MSSLESSLLGRHHCLVPGHTAYRLCTQPHGLPGSASLLTQITLTMLGAVPGLAALTVGENSCRRSVGASDPDTGMRYQSYCRRVLRHWAKWQWVTAVGWAGK